MAGVQTMARYGRPFPSLSLFGPCSGSLFSSLPAKKVFSLHDLNMLEAIISPLPESSLPPWDAMEMKLPSTKVGTNPSSPTLVFFFISNI